MPPTPPDPSEAVARIASEALRDEALDAYERIKAHAAQSGGVDWEIGCYRANGKASDWMFDIEDVSDLSTLNARLAQMHPEGGKFRVMARADSRIVARYDIGIAPRNGYSFAAPQASGVPTSETALLLERMMTMQRETNEMFRGVLERLTAQPATPARDPDAEVDRLMQRMLTMRDLMGRPDGEGPMKLLETVLNMAERINPGEREGGLLGLAKEFITSDAGKDLVKTLAGGIAPNGNGAVPFKRPVAPIIAPPVRHAPAPVVNHSAAMPPELTAGVEFLIEKAKTGADPALCADLVESMVPGPVLDDLGQQSDMLNYLTALYPAINPYRTWFAALLDVLYPPEGNGEPEHAAPFKPRAKSADSPA